MHAPKPVHIEALADRIEIQRLAAHQPTGAAGACQRAQHSDALLRRHLGVGDQVERQRLQGVAGEDRGGFVEGDVHGRSTAAQVIVVHGRQVVMHQRIGVDQFHCRRRRVER